MLNLFTQQMQGRAQDRADREASQKCLFDVFEHMLVPPPAVAPVNNEKVVALEERLNSLEQKMDEEKSKTSEILSILRAKF
jgi:hypothetical protein